MSWLPVQVDTEVFDVMMKDTGKPREELLKWAGTENELGRVSAQGSLNLFPCSSQSLHALVRALASTQTMVTSSKKAWCTNPC